MKLRAPVKNCRGTKLTVSAVFGKKTESASICLQIRAQLDKKRTAGKGV
jgi:hypothetical protein